MLFHTGLPSISWTLPSCFLSLCPRVALCINPAVRTSSDAGDCTLQPHTQHFSRWPPKSQAKQACFAVGVIPSPTLLLSLCPCLPVAGAGVSSQPPEQPCIAGAPLSVSFLAGDLEHCRAVQVAPGSFMQLCKIRGAPRAGMTQGLRDFKVSH